MVLLVTDVFVLLTQVLLWIVVGLFAWYVLLRALPRAFLGGLVLLLLLGVTAFTFYTGSPDQGLIGDIFRIISIPFSPLGIILILLLIAFSELVRGGKLSATGVVLLRIAVPALLILSLPAVSYVLARQPETEALQITRPAPALGAGERRVITVLAQDTTKLQFRPGTPAATTPNPAPAGNNPLTRPAEPLPTAAFNILANQPVQLTEQGDRLTYTARSYQAEQAAGNNPLVIVSAGSRPERQRRGNESRESISEAEDAARFLTTMGVPRDNIIVDANGDNVHDSAVNVRRILNDRNRNIAFGNQLVLVTSAIEMSRAAQTFRREFETNGQTLSVIPQPTDFQTIPQEDTLRRRFSDQTIVRRNFRLADLLPSIDALSLSSKVVNEYLSSIYYFLRGWIRPIRNF
jgi:uncharacterized SAM-binding protein YcdF (DUF218 family)